MREAVVRLVALAPSGVDDEPAPLQVIQERIGRLEPETIAVLELGAVLGERFSYDLIAAVAELGPSTAGQIEAHLESEPRGRKGPWWDRSETKWVAEALWSAGVLTTATRVGFACLLLIFGCEPWMICSARLETSRTYRNLLSMPSGNPSILLFLLESLGHPIDGIERSLCL